MNAPKLIVYGTGRCGTKTFTAACSTLSWPARCGHEALGDPLVAWAAQYAHGDIPHDILVANLRRFDWPDVAVSYMYVALLPALREAFPGCRFLWLHRDDEATMQSLIRKGWYLPADDDLPPVREWDRQKKAWWLWPQNWRVRGDLVTCDCHTHRWAGMSQEDRVLWWIGYVERHADPGDLFELDWLSWPTVAAVLESAGLQVSWVPGFRLPWVMDHPEGGREDWDGPST